MRLGIPRFRVFPLPLILGVFAALLSFFYHLFLVADTTVATILVTGISIECLTAYSHASYANRGVDEYPARNPHEHFHCWPYTLLILGFIVSLFYSVDIRKVFEYSSITECSLLSSCCKYASGAVPATNHRPSSSTWSNTRLTTSCNVMALDSLPAGYSPTTFERWRASCPTPIGPSTR